MYIAAGVSILVGLKMLGIIQFNLPNFAGNLVKKPRRQGLIPSFFMGLMMGLAGSQCGTPVLFAILTLVMSKGELLFGTILLFWYGLGRGIPVILAGTFTGFAREKTILYRWSQILERVAGGVLVSIGLYFIWIA